MEICKAYLEEYGTLTIDEYKRVIKWFNNYSLMCQISCHRYLKFNLTTGEYTYKVINIVLQCHPRTQLPQWKLLNKVRI